MEIAASFSIGHHSDRRWFSGRCRSGLHQSKSRLFRVAHRRFGQLIDLLCSVLSRPVVSRKWSTIFIGIPDWISNWAWPIRWSTRTFAKLAVSLGTWLAFRTRWTSPLPVNRKCSMRPSKNAKTSESHRHSSLVPFRYRRSYDSEYSAPLVDHHVWPALMQGSHVVVKVNAREQWGGEL